MLAGVLSHFSPVQLCATVCIVTRQAPLSMRFSRQEYCSGLPFPTLGVKYLAWHKTVRTFYILRHILKTSKLVARIKRGQQPTAEALAVSLLLDRCLGDFPTHAHTLFSLS